MSKPTMREQTIIPRTAEQQLDVTTVLGQETAAVSTPMTPEEVASTGEYKENPAEEREEYKKEIALLKQLIDDFFENSWCINSYIDYFMSHTEDRSSLTERKQNRPYWRERFLSGEGLRGQCPTISSFLQEHLKEKIPEIQCELRGSDHCYLVIHYKKGIPIYIDPTIRQFIQIPDLYFIGSKQQLHEVLLNPGYHVDMPSTTGLDPNSPEFREWMYSRYI